MHLLRPLRKNVLAHAARFCRVGMRIKYALSFLRFQISLGLNSEPSKPHMNVNILASTSVPFRPMMVQVPNLAQTWHELDNSVYGFLCVSADGRGICWGGSVTVQWARKVYAAAAEK